MNASKQPCEMTLKEASSAIATKELLPSQLLNSCLERIEALDSKIKAWALLDKKGAQETAQRLDDEVKRGKLRSPLHGIPVGLKDIIYTAGLRTEAGSKVMAGFVPEYDATVAARLKEAGAIILGKTHTTEFAFSDPAPTCNPWNTECTPGGSSSGSAAGVAAGMCTFALGSQTLGSVLRPAAYNGVIGFKPQHGRISVYGVVPVSWNLDHIGIFARTVEDIPLIFQAIAGYDARDIFCLNEPVPDCLSQLEQKKPPRIGVVRQHFFARADEEMRRHTEDAVKRLEKAGATVLEVKSPLDFAAVHETGKLIMFVEGAAYHEPMFIKHSAKYRPGIKMLVENGLKVRAIEYTRALQAQLSYRAEAKSLFTQCDVLLTPCTTGAAPRGLGSTGDPVMQAPWSILGLPAISLPIGLNKDGLPLAIQLTGPAKAEDKLLAAARWCEKALNVHLKPPLK